MKKVLLSLAVLLTLANGLQAEEKTSMRAGVYLGLAPATGGLAYGANFAMDNISKNIGFEAVGIYSGATVLTVPVSIMEIAGLATYNYPFAKNQSFTAKAGLGFASVSTSFFGTSISASAIGIAYGASYNYDLGTAGMISVSYYDFSYGVNYTVKF